MDREPLEVSEPTEAREGTPAPPGAAIPWSAGRQHRGLAPAGVRSLQGLAGNRAVTRTLATRRVLARDTAVHHQGYATGDVWGMAAMLIHDPKRHVFVSYTDNDRGKAEQIIKIYKESGVPDWRVHPVALAAEEAPFHGVHRVRRAYNRGKARADQIADHVEDLVFGTQYVGANFSKQMRDEVRSAWGVANLGAADAAIGSWLAGRGLATPATKSGKVLVIWSRFSGKRGDAHIEHDTSYEGVRQIVDQARSAGYGAVLITGDRSHGFKRVEDTTPAPAPAPAPVAAKGAWGAGGKTLAEKLGAAPAPPPPKRYKDPQAEKYRQIAAARSTDGFKVIDVTEFWKDADAATWLPAGTRTGQFKLFEYLQRHFAEVRHLGFRSGNLEAMALLGYTVRYLEEQPSHGPGAPGMIRMTQWHANQRPADAEPIGYERIQVSRPPTRSGRYWLRNRRGALPDWAPRYRSSTAKPNVGTDARGFQPPDLAEIGKYLNGER